MRERKERKKREKREKRKEKREEKREKRKEKREKRDTQREKLPHLFSHHANPGLEHRARVALGVTRSDRGSEVV